MDTILQIVRVLKNVLSVRVSLTLSIVQRDAPQYHDSEFSNIHNRSGGMDMDVCIA